MLAKHGQTSQLHGVGRRKSAVARVWLKHGSGKIQINGKALEEYFGTDTMRTMVQTPLYVCNAAKAFDINVNVVGGGLLGQAGATRLGIARALLESNEALRQALKQEKLLTVDARKKERKKYGQRGARAKFQFVKR